MNFALFSAVTNTGSALWCYILAYFRPQSASGSPRPDLEPEAMVAFIKSQSLGLS